MLVQPISKPELDKLYKNAKIILATELGPKVLENKNQEIIKVFYPKKNYFTSNKIFPYALRFCKNAKRLAELNVSAPIINKLYYCKENKAYIAIYNKIPGEELYTYFEREDYSFLEHFFKFIASLHSNGIFFRGIHLRNLLYQSPNQFGLIDIEDMFFRKKSLNFFDCYRNLKHLILYKKTLEMWGRVDLVKLLHVYFENLRMGYFSKKILAVFVRKFENIKQI